MIRTVTILTRHTCEMSIESFKHMLAARVNVPNEIDLYHNRKGTLYRIATIPYLGEYLDDDEALEYLIEEDLLPAELDLV